MTTYDTRVCVYEGGPATSVVTGEKGVRYGLCADCSAWRDKQQQAAPHIATIEHFRSQMRAHGGASPAVEKFADDMVLLLMVTNDPQRTMDILFAVLAADGQVPSSSTAGPLA